MIKRLLVFTFLLGFSVMAFGQTDSLGVERKGEQLLVLHKVQSGQTLFALARRYGATVKAIQDENPSLQQGLKVGQTIKIPYGKPIPVTREVSEPAKTHTVSAGETLYAISRKYSVSVDELKKLNNLTSNNLSLGQKLTIAEAKVVNVPVPAVETEKPATEEVTEVDPEEESPLLSQAETQVVDTTTVTTAEEVSTPPATEEIKQAEPVNYGGTTLEEMKEEGVAELIEEEEPTTKFLALHKTAKVGTVIKIRNLKNDLVVYVRVVGQIPDTADNENIMIKINKRAHDQLKAIDPRLRVELSYFH